jgi:hypothetical protein
MYGTGWMGRPGYGPNQPYYNPNAPPYQPPVEYQQTGNSNQGYYAPYGGPQPGVELQQPPNVYARGGDAVYAAPGGAPPGKADGVIR